MHARDPNFGAVLGRLYGANTLGAMVGAVIGEAILIEWLGIRGSAIFVAMLGISAGLAALLLARSLPAIATEGSPGVESTRSQSLSIAAWCYLAASFLAGGILLAFEVVWFRFLHLFAHGGGFAFALMLATVLGGIGVGGALAGSLIRRFPSIEGKTALVAFAAGCVSVGVYLGFAWVIDSYRYAYIREPEDVLWLAFCLTFIPSLLSGVLFTLLGAALGREVFPDSRATGLLTLSNTLGAGLGSIIGGFVLLPTLGMELSFWLLSGLYGVVGAILYAASRLAQPKPRMIGTWLVAAMFLASIVLFPSGLMEKDYLQRAIKRYRGEPKDVLAIREGVLQTNIYLRRPLDGETIHLRLITDGYSMSGTAERNRRYMKLFVYWPVALHPNPKRALLISYGVGETAKALTETSNFEEIDVVDISPEIVEASDILFPNPEDDPLNDPRVRVHIEDGRYFLKSRKEGYDLITGEPPPPKIGSVVSLYTREYFELVRERLNPGGINTYWLPVHNLLESDTKAIIRAYCDVFPDCALWSGSNLDWMLTGTREYAGGTSLTHFARQWSDPVVSSELATLGIDSPQLLGTLFMAGPNRLREITAETLPLIDDFPKRISNELTGPTIAHVYTPWMDVKRSREQFQNSALIRKYWPEEIRSETLKQFDYQRMLNETYQSYTNESPIKDLHRVLSNTSYRFLAVRLLGQDGDRLSAIRRLIAKGAPESRYALQLAIDSLVNGDDHGAIRYLTTAQRGKPGMDRLFFLRLYAVCRTGDMDRAQALANHDRGRFGRSKEGRALRPWFTKTFGLRL
jgi:spermidine synthase